MFRRKLLKAWNIYVKQDPSDGYSLHYQYIYKYVGLEKAFNVLMNIIAIHSFNCKMLFIA